MASEMRFVPKGIVKKKKRSRKGQIFLRSEGEGPSIAPRFINTSSITQLCHSKKCICARNLAISGSTVWNPEKGGIVK